MTDDRMPQRIQLSRKRGWRKPEGAVVVARPSRWGNPYKVGPGCTAEQAVALYRDWIERCAAGSTERWMQDYASVWNRHIKTYIRDQLRGKDLACWCPLDQACHGDELLRIANGEAS